MMAVKGAQDERMARSTRKTVTDIVVSVQLATLPTTFIIHA
jgi:hypothetical protein